MIFSPSIIYRSKKNRLNKYLWGFYELTLGKWAQTQNVNLVQFPVKYLTQFELYVFVRKQSASESIKQSLRIVLNCLFPPAPVKKNKTPDILKHFCPIIFYRIIPWIGYFSPQSFGAYSVSYIRVLTNVLPSQPWHSRGPRLKKKTVMGWWWFRSRCHGGQSSHDEARESTATRRNGHIYHQRYEGRQNIED